MNDQTFRSIPSVYNDIKKATEDSNFSMPSDLQTCCLLRTLAVSKPTGSFLELGTGTGLATSWILDGMDDSSTLISLDNDEDLLHIPNTFLGQDKRLKIVCSDGGEWIKKNSDQQFDYIFADTWHGKYLMLEETLNMLKKGGFYIVDDMTPQSTWPDGHEEKAIDFVKKLENKTDLVITKQHWAKGIIIAVKK